jgi:hypothetical protein
VTYRVWSADLLTGQRSSHSDIVATVTAWTLAINAPASIEGTASLDAVEDPVPMLEPDVTMVWVERSGILLCGGIVTKADPDIDARALSWSAAGPASYLDRIEITTDLVYKATDTYDIVRSLVHYAMGKTGSGIGLTVAAPTSSGVTVDITFAGADRRSVLDAITSLAEADDGFEWADQFSVDGGGTPVFVLAIGRPLGRDRSTSLLALEYPGTLATYTWPTSGRRGNVITGSTGGGTTARTSTQTDDASLAAGIPRLELTQADFDSSLSQARLDARTRELLRVSKGLQVVPTLTAYADSDQPLGSYIVGDEARTRLTSAYHRAGPHGEPGFDGWLRIAQISGRPQQTGGKPETVDLTMFPVA